MLDQPTFSAGEIAGIAGVTSKTVANWTDRGLADPYQMPTFSKRGRGQARNYSLRDGLRFALMSDLAGRYQVPLPLGKRICTAVFSEAFNPGRPGLLIVTGATAGRVAMSWFRDGASLAAHLNTFPMRACLIIDTQTTFRDVLHSAATLLATRKTDEKLMLYCKTLGTQGEEEHHEE